MVVVVVVVVVVAIVGVLLIGRSLGSFIGLAERIRVWGLGVCACVFCFGLGWFAGDALAISIFGQTNVSQYSAKPNPIAASTGTKTMPRFSPGGRRMRTCKQ